MQASLPPRLSQFGKPLSTGMELHERQRYVPYVRERNYGCRITECTFRGLRCVVLENQVIRISVAADKGADIYEFLHKPSDTEFLLRTPLGLRSQPAVLPTINLREGSFSDFYEGGWQELFPVAGDFPSELKGAQFGQHGEVALLPWSYQIKEDTPERIAVTFSVDTTRTPFHLDRTMILEQGKPALQIREKVRNIGDEAVEFMWAHHPAFGWPFLEEGCRIELPTCEVVVLGSETPPTSRLIEQEGKWPRLKGRNGAVVDLSQMVSARLRGRTIFHQESALGLELPSFVAEQGFSLSVVLAGYTRRVRLSLVWQHLQPGPRTAFFFISHVAARDRAGTHAQTRPGRRASHRA